MENQHVVSAPILMDLGSLWSSGPHRLHAHELWVENRSKHLLPGPNGLETHSEHLLLGPNGLEARSKHLLPGPNGLETDCRPKAFSNSLDLVIVCPAYVLSGAWKLQLPRNHTREALYSLEGLAPSDSSSGSFCARREPEIPVGLGLPP